MTRSRFLPAAEAEFLKEVAYYSNAREGLGLRFQAAVAEAITKATANPAGGAPCAHQTRRRLVKGFPFDVVYRAGDEELLVVAISHHRRRPDHWASRIR